MKRENRCRIAKQTVAALCAGAMLLSAVPHARAAEPDVIQAAGDIGKIVEQTLGSIRDKLPELEKNIYIPHASDWNLILVNPWNSVPEDYTVTLREIGNGQSVDERCADDLMDMLADCKARSGGTPVVCSSYRTQAKQQSLYDNKVKRLMKQGYSYETALTEAARVVAVPGTSEHQLGLAVDIVDKSYQILDKKQETTAVQKWLMEHAWEYGFILRYPNGTTDLTGIIYEPWHYRYVGRDAAADIRDKGVTLEEYIEMIRP